jgi:hypothetical protein
MRYEAKPALWSKSSLTVLDGSGDGLLASFSEAVDAYRALLASGVSRSDIELARDPDYERLLRAGQAIHRAGGEKNVLGAVLLLAGLVPGGAETHFDRLWCGMFTPRKA